MNNTVFEPLAVSEAEAYRLRLSVHAKTQLQNVEEGTQEAPEEPSADVVRVPAGVGFHEAATAGIQGRIIWAVATAGTREPLITRVYHRAQYPANLKKGYKHCDTPKAFEDAFNALIAVKVLEPVGLDRVRMVHNSPAQEFAVRCAFCPEMAPPGRGHEAAKEAAIAAGFQFRVNERDGVEYPMCPSHAAGAHLVPGGPRLNPVYLPKEEPTPAPVKARSRGSLKREARRAKRGAQ